MATQIVQQAAPGDSAAQPQRVLSPQFCCGDWFVQADLNRLQHRYSGLQRQLEPRLIKLLCFLAANPERVLSRNEIVLEIWPRVIVNENSLTRAISELRKQLEIAGADGRVYIETIPKKGYRLHPAVVSASGEAADRPELPMAHNAQLTLATLLQKNVGFAALCLSLLSIFWVGFDYSPQAIDPAPQSTLLVDEVMGNELDFLGGELTLSTMDEAAIAFDGIQTPVISSDGSQYAYLQHASSGSTIFLGNLDDMTEPTAVFNSYERLYNLAWSPLGNALLFVKQAKMTTTALFAPTQTGAELLMLDLGTLTIHRLIQELDTPESEPSTELNLT